MTRHRDLDQLELPIVLVGLLQGHPRYHQGNHQDSDSDSDEDSNSEEFHGYTSDSETD